MAKKISEEEVNDLLAILSNRFEKNMVRHHDLDWKKISERLKNDHQAMWSLSEMEKSGGEPDVVFYDKNQDKYLFFDCSKESPIGRRSFCFDKQALNSRKEHKPKDSAENFAEMMGVEILNEEEYRFLQTLGEFDLKTSSWIKTPDRIRKLGGALYCDRRYDTVFTYHNGAESYYAVRGFRGKVKV